MRTQILSHAARWTGRWAAMLFVVASAASCAPNGFAGASQSDSDGTLPSEDGAHAATRAEQNAGAPVQGVATFTAADVARIVLVLERSSITQAQLASERARTMEVKTYAARIVRERTEALERLAAILERVTPRSDDPTAPLFEKELARSRDWLLSQESSFDLPFMTAEIGAHARVLGMLEASLLPSASRATVRAGAGADGLMRELEDELVALRSQTAAQMVHALRVQGVLRAGNAPVDEATMTTGGSAVAEGAGSGPPPPR